MFHFSAVGCRHFLSVPCMISPHSIRHIFYAYSLCSRLFSQVLPEVATPHTRPTLHGPRASAGLRAVANIYEQHTKTDNAMSSFQHSSVNILYQVSLRHAAKQLSNRPAGSAHLRMHQHSFSSTWWSTILHFGPSTTCFWGGIEGWRFARYVLGITRV